MTPSKLRTQVALFLTFLVLLLCLSCANANRLICTRVVDGDTIVLSNGEKVRLIGVDTPETKHPRKPVEYYPMDATNMIKRIWYPTLRRAGLPQYRLHLLRHTNASLRIEAGQNIKYIQNQLGHSSIQVTLDIYGHLMKPVNSEEAEKLRATLFSSKNSEDGSKMVAEEKNP